MTKNFWRTTACLLGTLLGSLVAQDVKLALPTITNASVPLYPALARAANLQGMVHVKVTTDGRRVIGVHGEDSHKLLATAAEASARTWQFAIHEPTTFTITYRYKLDSTCGDPNNATITLRLPTEVEVCRVPIGSNSL